MTDTDVSKPGNNILFSGFYFIYLFIYFKVLLVLLVAQFPGWILFSLLYKRKKEDAWLLVLVKQNKDFVLSFSFVVFVGKRDVVEGNLKTGQSLHW